LYEVYHACHAAPLCIYQLSPYNLMILHLQAHGLNRELL
jgi:hypothetical protein